MYPLPTISLRMRQKSSALFLTLLTALMGNLSAQYSDCSSALIVEGNTPFIDPGGVGNKLEYLACGGIEHNTVWFAFQAKANGKLNFVIRPYTLSGIPTGVDVDWSLYKLNGSPNTTNCNNKTQLSCNFAGGSTVFGIAGATGMATPNYAATQFNPGIDVVSGTWYVLMVDQFSNTTPTNLMVQFTGNPESAALNSSPGIFDDRPDFTYATTSSCDGAYTFTNTSTAVSGIASYLWDFGDGSSATAANPSHTYVTPGTYYVTLAVTDNNGKTTYIRKTVVNNNTTPPTANTSGIFVTPSCTDGNNGTLTVVTAGATTLGALGGTAPYTFALVSPSPKIVAAQSSNTFNNLPPGTYTVKITDMCGRSATANATVTQLATNSTIGLGIQNTQSACANSATGTATIFASGTVPPYTMALVASSPILVAPSTAVQRDPVTATYYTTFNNLLPGLYTVEAIDACGKARRATFTVSASTAPIATTVSSPSCAATPTGTLNVTATGSNGLSGGGSPGNYEYALIQPSPIARPFQTGSVFENLYPGTYTIAVKDACGNIGTATATVAAATAPIFGTHFTTASCPNASTGTLQVQLGTVPGGGAPYTYELIAPSVSLRPAQTTNDFVNLPAGAYTIRLTDACGVSITGTTTIVASSAPSFTTTLVSSCSTPENGSITVVPAAAVLAPYSFELISPGAAIRPPQPSNIANSANSIFTNLKQGGYTIKMTDGCGSAVTGTATIAAPTALSFPAGSSAMPSCGAGSTGRIVVAVPTNGSGPYLYELIAPSPLTVAAQTSRIFDNLPTGNYTIRITDACGTQVDNSASPLALGTSSAPTFTATNTASCATASGTITVSNGTSNQGGGMYQYALIAPSPVTRPNQTSPIFTALPAGAYTIQVTDQCGLTGTNTSTIAAAGAFTPAAGGSVVSCTGSAYNSQIIVTNPQNFTPGGPIPPGSGGGPYTFALYDATNTTLLAGPQSSNVFSTVVPVSGSPSHTIRVTDVCGNTGTTTVAVNPPAALSSATITAITASCTGSNTGVIRVTTGASGGLVPYQYSLINAVNLSVVAGPQSGTTFNNVPANATGYFVRTIDACGNVVTSGTAVPFPAAVSPTATVTTLPSCASGATGRITVTPGTGSTLAGGTFSYALYDVSNTTLVRPTQASPVFDNLAAANYTVRITDKCGNVGTAAATVSSSVTALTASGVPNNTCSGGSSGSVVGSFTGGSLPITYSLVDQATSNVIAGPQTDNVFAGLALGTYIVRVIDACGTVANSVNLPVGDLTSLPTINTSVALDCGGTATISAYGGTGNGGPYTYAICTGSGCTNFGSYTSSNSFTITTSGTYRISVLDRCGNTNTSADIVVNVPTQPVITSIVKDVACGPTTLTINATGIPNTPYYSVNGGNFAPSIGTLASGVYSIRVADFNAGTFGCASAVSNVTVSASLPAPTLVSTPAIQTICPGTNTTLAAAPTQGGTITWYWFTGTWGASPMDSSTNVNFGGPANPITVSPSATRIYYAGETASGCRSAIRADARVNISTLPVANAGPDRTLCIGGSTTIGSNPVTGWTYTWTPATGLSNANVSKPTVSAPNSSITYSLVVKNALGCENTDQVDVNVNPLPTANAGADVTTCSGQPTVIGAASMVGYSYTWSPSVALDNRHVSMPTHLFSSTSTNPVITRYVVLVKDDDSGCTNRDTVFVTTNPRPSVTQTNAGADRTIVTGASTQLGSGNVIQGLTYSWSPPTGLSSTNVLKPTASPTTTTTYTLTVSNALGCSRTDDVLVTVVPVRIADGDNNLFGIHPNPAASDLQLYSNRVVNGQISVSLVNTTGQEVLTLNKELNEQILEETLNIRNLSSGVYYLQVNDGNSTQTFKLIKE